MFQTDQFAYQQFERTKTAVKKAPYIVAAGIFSLFMIFALAAIYKSEGNDSIVKPQIMHKLPFRARPAAFFTLFDAVTYGDLGDVKSLIDKGMSVDEQDEETGETPLHFAIRRGDEAIVKILLENGANGNIQSNDGFSPLALALETNQQVIAHLISKDHKLGVKSWNKDVLKHKGCNVSDEMAATMLAKGVNVSDDSSIALRKAIEDDDEVKAKLILDNCFASINGDNEIHFFLAAESCKVKVATMLITNGANIDEVFNHHWRVIHVSAHKGCKEVTQLLIDNNANINDTISLGYSPLCIATQDCRRETAEILRKAGAVMEPADCIHRAC